VSTPTLIDPVRFRDAYLDAVTDVMAFITRERQEVIAIHCLSLHPDRHDLRTYLTASLHRYANVIELFNLHSTVSLDELRLLEVGGFLGAFPLALARLGVPVTLVEEYDYYGGALDQLKTFLENESINIVSTDFTVRAIQLEDFSTERFTLVTNMAMVEHLPSSPKMLLENLHRVTAEDGKLMLEVPNIAHWPNRLRLLRGRSIHPAIDGYYDSEPPFLDHHREYTEQELRQVLSWSGFAIDDLLTFNYTLDLRDDRPPFDRLNLLIAYWWAIRWFRSCREVLLACASPIKLSSGATAHAVSYRPVVPVQRRSGTPGHHENPGNS
jgi:2-polyprenyl-3-methyl-5-hydroxy-6-metoxy-1,4-benzoquinol methylase